jgi:hypothetical protein
MDVKMNKEAVDLTLSRIKNIDSQREFLTTLCRSMIKEELPEPLQDAIVNDIDIQSICPKIYEF